MGSLADFEFNKAPLCDGMVLISEQVRDDFPSRFVEEERQMELALRASEALLQFNPEDPYEIRDRGLIYAQLDCDHVALLDLSYFVEQCPEDPISEMIRAQINTISHKQITLH
ncbi:TPA: tetratricopeptide repeat protein [Klebsiella pneumoniae]|nr:tetratricopeptide repeat protein [Klebsiella pneumoniae]HEM0569359.1 tetratricopeptide repeat protein [Klebsiella pneumoniae]